MNTHITTAAIIFKFKPEGSATYHKVTRVEYNWITDNKAEIVEIEIWNIDSKNTEEWLPEQGVLMAIDTQFIM